MLNLHQIYLNIIKKQLDLSVIKSKLANQSFIFSYISLAILIFPLLAF